MKRLLVVVLTLAILFSSAPIAEGQTVEQKANEIFNSLANIYDSLLFYLEQRQTTWTALMAANPKEVGPQWFMKNIYVYDDIERATAIIAFGSECGLAMDQIMDADHLYNELFLPLYKSYGETAEGLEKACFAFAMMIFYDETLGRQLGEEKRPLNN